MGGFTRNSASNMTFAFHAIHAATLEAKLGRVREAIAASGTSMVGRCQPSDSADADPKARATRSQDNRGQPAGADPMFRSLQAGVAASELLVQQMLAASGERSTEWLLLLRSSGGAAQLRAQLTTKALASMAGESDFVVRTRREHIAFSTCDMDTPPILRARWSTHLSLCGRWRERAAETRMPPSRWLRAGICGGTATPQAQTTSRFAGPICPRRAGGERICGARGRKKGIRGLEGRIPHRRAVLSPHRQNMGVSLITNSLSL